MDTETAIDAVAEIDGRLLVILDMQRLLADRVRQ